MVARAKAYETRLIYPYLSQGFGKILVRHSNLPNMVIFRNQIVKYHLLPKPYDTDCTPQRQDAYFDCLESSLNSSISRYPPGAYTSKPLKIQPLHVDDLINKKILQAVNDAYSKCKPLYSKFVCQRYVSATDLEYFNSRTQTGLRITASTPLSAMMSVTSYPLLYLRDLVYYVSGCVSFWFGLSVMHLNPSKIKHRVLETKAFGIYRIRLILSSFFIVCCFIGFVIHVSLTALDYFEYKTSSEMSLDQRDTLRYPSLLICFKYYYDPNGSLTYYAHAGSEKNLRLPNVKTLLDLSPDTFDFVTHCALNDESTSSLNINPKNECLSWFSVSKAVAGSRICYQIVPAAGLYYSWSKVTSRLRQSNEIYGLRLNKSFSDADVVSVTYFYTPDSHLTKIPVYERHYSKRFVLKHGVEGAIRENFIGVYAEQHHYFGLPPPYNPGCDERIEASTCLRECFLIRHLPLQRVPYSELIFQASELKVLHYKDMEENATFNRMLMSLAADCRKKCMRLPCNFKVSFTEGQDFLVPHIHQFMVHLFAPTSPELVITTVPWELLQDFLLYLSNCLGIWFGISVLSLNPSRLREKANNVHCSRSSKTSCFFFN